MRRTIVRVACSVTLVLGGVAAGAPSASAAPSGDIGVASARGAVHGNQPIWRGVNPFSNQVGTTIEGEGFLATCKRWGADQRWWYWSRMDLDGLTGHIPGNQTNLAHSWLDVCS